MLRRTMPTCKRCRQEFVAEDLVRHERPRTVVVHCPECKHPMGRYDRHGDDPHTDRRRI